MGKRLRYKLNFEVRHTGIQLCSNPFLSPGNSIKRKKGEKNPFLLSCVTLEYLTVLNLVSSSPYHWLNIRIMWRNIYKNRHLWLLKRVSKIIQSQPSAHQELKPWCWKKRPCPSWPRVRKGSLQAPPSSAVEPAHPTVRLLCAPCLS